MPRYYFDFREGTRAVIDHVGREFRSDGAARQEALLTARDAITGIRLGLRPYGGWVLEVRDETGRVVHAVPIPKTGRL
jgi:hypothetical protein